MGRVGKWAELTGYPETSLPAGSHDSTISNTIIVGSNFSSGYECLMLCVILAQQAIGSVPIIADMFFSVKFVMLNVLRSFTHEKPSKPQQDVFGTTLS